MTTPKTIKLIGQLMVVSVLIQSHAPTVYAQGAPSQETVSGPDVQPALPGLTGSLKFTRRLRKAIAHHGVRYIARTHHLDASGRPKYVNRLIMETSPYLLQHAHNPVNWYPWGPKAFEHAKKLGRPIFLSVGYSTCHWCHVMERESFEDLEIAEFINKNFVPIKVDREERPDVDDVYMSAVHLLHGRGGWPMTVMMTPKRAFFGGHILSSQRWRSRSRKRLSDHFERAESAISS